MSVENTIKGNGETRSLLIENLEKEYVKGKPVLKGLSFEVSGEETVGIIGPSGTGKSTLLRCINRLIEPTKGSITVAGHDITTYSGKDLRLARRRIGMVFQEYNLVERLTVIENVLCGRLGYIPVWRAWLRKFDQADINRAFKLIDHVGLGEFATQRADSLSGGQRQRVGIARAMMQSPDVIMADEPTSSLDPKTSVEIMELLKMVSSTEHIPVLINIHDVNLAKRFCDRIIGMSKGKIIFDGHPSELKDSHLSQIYGGEDWLS
ncbi:phosphonate ABC transporter ATP-binding protein [Halodesulfovibrio aestuarii]|uniref:Phosphonate ABC transporter ATP-binding protein n=1 Tax=Halodesulfovibrio aestuarii TaxID=126333 RepID=A0A8G2CBZ8_9BACT|nr:phosphonate ABC transporter ATP-binding protein [Halodesulfovibrio aestuarii]SHJ67606.1 phosphonate transport system ATP-binding protein [Halodesulfovibrio aestuarii]